MTRRILACIIFTTSVLFMSHGARAGFVLASDGQTAFTIVIPDDAIPAEKTAARELQEHLKQMTGAEFPVVSAADFGGGPRIAIGFQAGLPEKLAETNYPNLGPEEFVIDGDGEVVLLAGGRPRGALYATYEFLERLGVRWFTPTETFVPERPELSVDVVPERYTSPFRSRTNVIGNNPTREWSARNRMNSFIEWGNPGEEYGGGVLQGPDMDNMWRYVSPTVFRDHPEWAAMVNGERQIETGGTNNWGTCLSNAEFRGFVVARVMDWLRAHADYTGVWLTSNDGSPYCTCPDCQAIYDAHGGRPAAAQMILVNELADRVAEEFPQVRVKTLAYGWSRQPPKGIKLRDNVTVMLCATNFGFFGEIGYGEGGRQFVEEAEEWKTIAPELEVYLYSHPYNDFWYPAPCLYNQARNIRRIKDLGFRLIHQEDFGKMGLVGGEQCALRSWLFTRMAWRPDSDVEELVQDFCRGYYGKSAQDVLYAIHRTEEAHSSGWTPPDEYQALMVPGYVDAEAVADIVPRLMKAYESQNDPVLKQRVGYVLLPYLWADYWLGVKSFMKVIPEEGIWGADIAERERREKEGALIRSLMVENGINALQESGRFNPHTLRLPELARAYSFVSLADDATGAEAVVVPGLMGKMTIFSRGGHNVVKPLWGHIKSQYPEYGYVRDFFNGYLPAAFQIASEDKGSLELQAALPIGTARKTFEFKDGALVCTLELEADAAQELQIRHQPLLDLNQDAFGFYPELHVEFGDGWRLTRLGRSGTFWYQDGSIDIQGFTGRMVLVAESGDFALELAFLPDEMEGLDYMYDRYDAKPDGTGHILELMFRTPKAVVEAGGRIRLQIRARILLPGEIPNFDDSTD